MIIIQKPIWHIGHILFIILKIVKTKITKEKKIGQLVGGWWGNKTTAEIHRIFTSQGAKIVQY